ncbi:MAG: tetratricopeptide repeat protein [Chloroflexi bacterium]|nr:tetratricopeptide repeat protein [Chloroflexota bacterium]
MTEVVRLLAQEGELTQDRLRDRDSWEIRVPEGVREVIGRRLNRLSERCNETLTVAAVIGREFTLNQLDRLIEDMTSDMVLDVLEEALSARLIQELPSAMGQYQFTHALMQETLIDELSLTRRVRLHARIAETLEAMYGDDAESHAAELAHHFAQAEAVLGTDKLVKYLILAGESAISSNAYEEALIHFQKALTAKQGPSNSDGDLVIDVDTASILFGLGRTQAATSAWTQSQEAVNALRRAFDAFVELGDTDKAVAVALHHYGYGAFSSGTADMMARALELVPSGSLDAGYLLAGYGEALSWEIRDFGGAQESLDQAVEIARREGDQTLEVRSLVLMAQTHFAQGHYDDAVEMSLPVIELAESLDELDALVRARFMCANVLITRGNSNEAQKHAKAGLDAAERLHDKLWLNAMLRHNFIPAILRGDWKVAQEFNARSLAELPSDAITLSDRVLLNLQVGNLEESNEYVDRLLNTMPKVLVGAGLEHMRVAFTVAMAARVTGRTELLEVAESAARDVISASPSHINAFRAHVGLALTAIQRSDLESASKEYAILESQKGTQAESVICYDRLLGLLAQTLGNLGDAQAHFEEALAFCRKAGYRPELAWSLCDYADMLLERASTSSPRTEEVLRQAQDDRTKAVAMLDEALAISTELGMRPLMERVLSRREILKA